MKQNVRRACVAGVATAALIMSPGIAQADETTDPVEQVCPEVVDEAAVEAAKADAAAAKAAYLTFVKANAGKKETLLEKAAEREARKAARAAAKEGTKEARAEARAAAKEAREVKRAEGKELRALKKAARKELKTAWDDAKVEYHFLRGCAEAAEEEPAPV